MQNKHALPRTTHTLEMTQIAELNDHLSIRDPAQPIRAADLGVAGVTLLSGGDAAVKVLPAEAILERLCYEGPPAFPYVHAHFRPAPAAAGTLTIDLHTLALRELSHLLHLHEVWGVGSTGGASGR
jgi:hypothetical protein